MKKVILFLIFTVLIGIIGYQSYMIYKASVKEEVIAEFDLTALDYIEKKYGDLLFFLPASDNMSDYNDTIKLAFTIRNLNIDNDSNCYNSKDVDNEVVKYFGAEAIINKTNYEQSEFGDKAFTKVSILSYDSEKDAYCMNGDVSVYGKDIPVVTYEWINIKTIGDKVELTGKAIFRDNNLNVYNDSLYKNKIGSFRWGPNYNIINDDNKSLNDYLDDGYTYQYTFDNLIDLTLLKVSINK